MAALDKYISVDGKDHWITVYRSDTRPELSLIHCGYYCPILCADGTHSCKVFVGTKLKTKEVVADDGDPIIIAARCKQCLRATAVEDDL